MSTWCRGCCAAISRPAAISHPGEKLPQNSCLRAAISRPRQFLTRGEKLCRDVAYFAIDWRQTCKIDFALLVCSKDLYRKRVDQCGQRGTFCFYSLQDLVWPWRWCSKQVDQWLVKWPLVNMVLFLVIHLEDILRPCGCFEDGVLNWLTSGQWSDQ